MIQHLLRFGTGVAFLILVFSPASGQDKEPPKKEKAPPPDAVPKDIDDYRQYFKKPETADEYWKAFQFEIDIGQYQLAAQLLHGLATKPPTDEELLALEAKYGLSAFLKLRTLPPLRDRGMDVPRWSDDPKIQKQTLDDIETLIKLMTDAVKRKLADRDRILKLVQGLTTAPEEASFSLKELYTYRAAAVPVIVDELRVARDDERRTLKTALTKLSSDVVPPLVAALDSNDPDLIMDVIDIFMKRGAKDVVTNLWYLSAAPDQPERVRAKATAALVYFLDAPAAKLPPAKVVLTREAERYFQHQVTFADPKNVIVWRWDKGIVKGWKDAETVPQTKAEEYYGLRFARQALALDATYRPAQETLVALLLDKTMETVDLSQPLAKTAPAVHDLLTTINPDVLTAVLERAMTEKRTTIVLACVRALGELAEVRAAKPTGHGEPALVRALDYGDDRVQMAAAEALLRMPSAPSLAATKRILEILNRYLGVAGQVSAKPKAIVASGDAEARLRIVKAVQDAGYETVPVATGRDVLRRVHAASDISAIILESTLPDPGLASFLAQVRADVSAKQLPVVLIAVPDSAASRQLVNQYREERDRVQFIISKTAPYRKMRLDIDVKYEQDRKRILTAQSYEKEADRRAALLVLDNRHKEDLENLARNYSEPAVLDLQSQDLERHLDALSEKYNLESQKREEALKRWLEGSPTVTVVSTGALDDPKKLESRLRGEDSPTPTKPLTADEQTAYAEKAIQYFARMARGEITGYDIRPYADTIFKALHAGKLSEKGQSEALDVVARLTVPRAQRELADVVLDDKRPLPLRLKATDELIKHIQQNSQLLSNEEVVRLRKLYDDAGLNPDWKDFKAKLAVLQGTLRPGAQQSGERLRDFQPPPPGPPKMAP